MSRQSAFAIIFLVLGLLGSGFTEEVCWGDPFDSIIGEDAGEEEKVTRNESETNVGAWLASVFSKHISAVDGDRCPSEPTCSRYSVQAFKKHGLVMGWLMTVDRLIHEADEWNFSPVKNRGGKGKIIDPVQNNDYWWYENESQAENH